MKQNMKKSQIIRLILCILAIALLLTGLGLGIANSFLPKNLRLLWILFIAASLLILFIMKTITHGFDAPKPLHPQDDEPDTPDEKTAEQEVSEESPSDKTEK